MTFEHYLLHYVWLSILLWIALFFGDYYLTFEGAKRYNQKPKEHIIYEKSYELNPVFQEDVENFNLHSKKFWAALFINSALIYIIWIITYYLFNLSKIFSMVLGIYYFRSLVVILRHIRNLTFFNLVENWGGVQGKITYSYQFSLINSSNEFLTFSILFLIFFFVTGGFFLLGGFLGCGGMAYNQRKLFREEHNNPLLISNE